MSRSGAWLFTAVPIFIAVIFMVLIVWYIVVGVVAVKMVEVVQEEGLKAVVEQVWEGKKEIRDE